MGARPFCARAAPRPGCAWPRSHSAAPFARTRGRSIAVADPTRTPSVRAQLASAFVPGPARVHAGRSVAVTNPTRTPSLRAQLAVVFVPGLARVHAGAFWHRHRLRPDPFALSPWCVREGRRGQCVLYPRLRKGRQRARRRAQSGGKRGLARAGETVGAHCPSSTPLGGKGERHRNAGRARCEWGL